MSYQATLSNKHLEKIFVDLSAPTYKDKVEPSMACSNRCGNMYTGSLYGGLASLICSVNPEDLLHKRISMFAFGAGCAASFFTIRVKGSTAQMAKELDVHRRLNAIKVVPCTEFVAALKVGRFFSRSFVPKTEANF
jgi:hydroxymethylglutaryl-CoA synthase